MSVPPWTRLKFDLRELVTGSPSLLATLPYIPLAFGV